MQDMRIDAFMVRNQPADLGIMARAIMNRLDELKKDPQFIADFKKWKEERKNGTELQRKA